MGYGRKKLSSTLKDIQRDVEKARLTALNRSAKTAFSRTLRSIREDYAIKASVLKEYFKYVRASKRSPVVHIYAYEKPIGLIKFNAKPMKKGVKATVKKGNRKLYPGTFIRTMKSGHTGVFKREGKARLKIKELYGLDPGKLFADKQAQTMLQKVFLERFDIELSSASKYVK